MNIRRQARSNSQGSGSEPRFVGSNANGLTMDEQKVKNGAKRKKLPHEKVKLTERSNETRLR